MSSPALYRNPKYFCFSRVWALADRFDLTDGTLLIKVGKWQLYGIATTLFFILAGAFGYLQTQVSNNADAIGGIENQLSRISGQLSVLTARAQLDDLGTDFAALAPDLPVTVYTSTAVGQDGRVPVEPGLHIYRSTDPSLVSYGWENQAGVPEVVHYMVGKQNVYGAFCLPDAQTISQSGSNRVRHQNCAPISNLEDVAWDASKYGDKSDALIALSEFQRIAELINSTGLDIQFGMGWSDTGDFEIKNLPPEMGSIEEEAASSGDKGK